MSFLNENFEIDYINIFKNGLLDQKVNLIYKLLDSFNNIEIIMASTKFLKFANIKLNIVIF